MTHTIETDCPECGQVATVCDYDYGIDSETGYHDTGIVLKCRFCRITLADKEIDEAFARNEALAKAAKRIAEKE
jgi:hypothetical protein